LLIFPEFPKIFLFIFLHTIYLFTSQYFLNEIENLLILNFPLAAVWAGDHERLLYDRLTHGYNVLARPVRNETEAVKVHLGMDLQAIIDIVSLGRTQDIS
jgi:hypothetical protein